LAAAATNGCVGAHQFAEPGTIDEIDSCQIQ